MKKIKSFNEYNHINENNENNTFMNWLKNKYQNESEWTNIKDLDCSGYNLIDLDGIDKLPNLINLNCSFNKLKILNVKKLKRLQKLLCSHNEITELVINDNDGLMPSSLKYLQCDHNLLTDLNLNALKNLKKLYYFENKFSTEKIEEIQKFKKENAII